MDNMNFKFLYYIFFLFAGVVTIMAAPFYPGRVHVYLIFTALLNALLLIGFRKNRLFFDTFIGIFLWLGFWFKFSFKVAFLKGVYTSYETGQFDFSGTSFDHTLYIASCAALALMVSSYLRERYIFKYPERSLSPGLTGLFYFYQKNRYLTWILFIVFFVTIAITNLFFGIYQRGTIPQTKLPFGLNGVYTWLLLFGATSVSSILIHFEIYYRKKITFPVILLSLFETLFSNVSMLSRGMVINIAALCIGGLKSIRGFGVAISLKRCIAILLAFLVLFVVSITMVSHLRDIYYYDNNVSLKITNVSYNAKNMVGRPIIDRRVGIEAVMAVNTKVMSMVGRLIVDRWVGIEGVMAISSYQNRGWGLWKQAWQEEYSETGTSFYDLNLVDSHYANIDLSKRHFISLPGIIAFLFYPGSYLFLFFSLLIIGLICSSIEVVIFKLSGSNVVFCALTAQVIAYRLAHFGYVPARSYLLLGTIFLNVLLFYVADRILRLICSISPDLPDQKRVA